MKDSFQKFEDKIEDMKTINEKKKSYEKKNNQEPRFLKRNMCRKYCKDY